MFVGSCGLELGFRVSGLRLPGLPPGVYGGYTLSEFLHFGKLPEWGTADARSLDSWFLEHHVGRTRNRKPPVHRRPAC